MAKKIKFDMNSQLFVKKIIGRFQDDFGRTVIKTQWFKVDNEVDLGSLTNRRNEDIIEYKYEIPDPDKQPTPADFFGGLFKR